MKKLSKSLIFLIFILVSCQGLDTTLSVADQTLKAAITILQPTNPDIAFVLNTADVDLQQFTNLYKVYEKATTDAKPGLASQLVAVSNAITANLAETLKALKIKNPALVTDISVAVAVANSAITIIVNSLPKPATAPHVLISKPELPIIPNAKKADDLKKAWNNQIKNKYPQAVIK